ncbi:GAF domain-containing sensor histidine kinase [Paenibacillus albidus]|uniref:GAF domain-containing sensor histidine kinase n=1 Tax=Paenibacillus albidus TaxID=2041023 RepID=UPI002035ED0F|nr:GAF domain-containing sensor histidine kinase [Paenibacillus albidus]
MRCGSCWCLNRLWDGRLDRAVNIVHCKRLEEARQYSWGDSLGITHHASIPLRSGERRIGLLNVASPGKVQFKDSELALLQAVALQIGSTIERIRLYSTEQRRARLYARLGEFSTALGLAGAGCTEPEALARQWAGLIGRHFDWPFAAILGRREQQLEAFAVHMEDPADPAVTNPAGFRCSASMKRRLELLAQEHRYAVLSPDESRELLVACSSHFAQPEAGRMTILAAPVPQMSTQKADLLLIASPEAPSSLQPDGEVLEALAEHLAAALESVRLGEKRRELARLEERNRLARDLHDSVNQILFSMSMTAKGVEGMLAQEPAGHPATGAVRDIRELSQTALKEMRALIMQLRPAGLEAGLLTALQTYGQQQGLYVQTSRSGIRELPHSLGEGLWRIGQEALNNVRKHSGVAEAEISLQLRTEEAILSIADRGQGGAKRRRTAASGDSLGLRIMKERAEAMSGRLAIRSSIRHGTVVEVTIPLPRQSM